MENYRIESKEEIETYLSRMRYALDNGAQLKFQADRQVDENRDIQYTNKYTVTNLFPDESPVEALKRELKKLTVENYIMTVPDTRIPDRSEMRVFGKVYNDTDDVYIKVRVELLSKDGSRFVFVMSFHYAEKPFSKENFPYS